MATREETAEHIKVEQAFVNRKQIEYNTRLVTTDDCGSGVFTF